MNVPADMEWKEHFVAYENALTSFYALQDETERTLEQSYEITKQLEQLQRLRRPILESRRAVRSAAGVHSGVAEIDREQATIQLADVPLQVMDLVAQRSAPNDTLLELSFRVSAAAMSRFVDLTGPVRIVFPFAESTFVAAFRLAHFTLVSREFAFRFATVDPPAPGIGAAITRALWRIDSVRR